jgi:ankyrin repeat protein
MLKQLPDNASLEHLKSQAKSLLTALQSNDAGAQARLAGLPIEQPFQLADAQFVIAREYGFDSWSKLKRHVEGATDRVKAFFAAIRAGDRTRVQALIAEDSALVRARDEDDFGAPPITLATYRNDLPMIDLLLASGADVDDRSNWWAGGFGPLDLASEETSLYLLKRGATLTAHAAARLGMANELAALIAANPSVVHERGGDGQFPLHFAKTPEIVDILVDAGADLDARDLDHEGTAAQHRIFDAPVLRRLVERGATQDVFTAAALDDVETLGQLLDTDPGAISRRALEPGNPWIPSAPGGAAYTYNIGNTLPYMLAAHLGNEDARRLLWERATPAQRLSWAAWSADRDLALSILAENPGVLDQLSHGELRVLPDAAWLRRLDAVRLCLELGFDPNARGDDASAAIDRAAFHGFDDVIEAILPDRPDLTVRNTFGGTPLGACLYGSLHSWRKDGDFPRSVRLLIEAGAVLPEKPSGSPEVRAVLAEFGLGD